MLGRKHRDIVAGDLMSLTTIIPRLAQATYCSIGRNCRRLFSGILRRYRRLPDRQALGSRRAFSPYQILVGERQEARRPGDREANPSSGLGPSACETNARRVSAGLSDGRRFASGLTQVDLAEICGLTNVHVTRVLREERMCVFRASLVEILDLPRLVACAEFDLAYLYIADQRNDALSSN